MSWSSRLEFAPITTPDGKQLVTLSDARAFLLTIPETEATRIAAGELLKAAEQPNQITLHCARQALSRALYAPVRPEPVRKETWKERRRARRG